MLATSSLTHYIAIVAPTLSILQCVIQAVHISREGAEGVSLLTWILSIFVSEIWAGYGVVFHVAAEIYSNISFLGVAAVVIVIAASHQNKLRRTLLSALVVTAIAIAMSLLGLSHRGRWTLATVAVAGAIVIYVPQLIITLRSRDLMGVSVASWSIALVTSLSWGAYGLLIHQNPVALPSVVMIPSTLVIIVQASRHRLRARTFDGARPVPLVE